MQHELGWEVGGNIEHRTPNIEHRSEEKRKKRLRPALSRLNPDLPDLPVRAIEGAVEEMGILNGRGRRKKGPRRVDFLISLKATVSPSAETVKFTEIERLQDFTESTNFTAC